jgi:hypothetical protein
MIMVNSQAMLKGTQTIDKKIGFGNLGTHTISWLGIQWVQFPWASS